MRAFLARISTRNKIIVGAVALIIVVILILNARSRANSTAAFQTEPVQRGELIASIGATGTVRAAQSASLRWQITGVVDKVNAHVGDHVQKGDVLATLDQTQLPQSVILAKSDLVTAQKALEDASSDTASAQAAIDLKKAQDAYKKAYNYRMDLNGKQWIEEVVINYVGGQQIPEIRWHKGIPDQQTIQDADNDLALKKARLDDAQRTYDRLKAGPNSSDILAAQARVDAAQATLNLASLTAPIDGVVTQADSLPGDTVGSTASAASSTSSSSTAAIQSAFRIDDLSSLLVDVQVSEVDINGVAVDQEATLTLDAVPNTTYHGRVVKVSQAGDVSSGAVNFTVTVQLTDPDAQVKPGMTAAVNVIIKQVKDQILVPNRAVRLVDAQRMVYILKDGRAQQVKITLGPSSDSQSVVTGGDLKEGDLLILNPPQLQGGPFGGPGGG
jgi:HlyD family secretion protein